MINEEMTWKEDKDVVSLSKTDNIRSTGASETGRRGREGGPKMEGIRRKKEKGKGARKK